jgi:hypothetical protein
MRSWNRGDFFRHIGQEAHQEYLDYMDQLLMWADENEPEREGNMDDIFTVITPLDLMETPTDDNANN